MASLWYCCECNFGPHNSSLYMACINCDTRRCSYCVEEKGYDHDTLRSHSHAHCHETSPYPSAVTLDTAQTRSIDTKSMFIAPELPGLHPLSRLRPSTAQASPFGGPAKIYSHSSMYICCKCQDGPKLWDNQPQCVICDHKACSNCTPVK